MNIPGPFTLVDVDFNRTTEAALELSESAGFATLTYGPNGTLLPGSATGLANDATNYTANVTVDGTPVAVAVTGSTAQTFTTLLAQINTDLGVTATATLVGNTIVITSTTTGSASSVVVADSGVNGLFASVKGPLFGLLTNTSTKGNVKYLRWNKLDGVSRANVSSVMASFLTAAPANTNVLWTFARDRIRITGTGITPLSTIGIAAGTYNLNVNVDSAGAQDVPVTVGATISVNGITSGPVTTFQQLVDDQLAPNVRTRFPGATVSIVQVNTTTMDIFIQSPTAGTTGTVAVVAGTTADLIAAIDATTAWGCTVFAAIAGVDGTTDLVFPKTFNGVAYANWGAVLEGVKGPTGFAPLFTSGADAVIEVENKPAARGRAVQTFVYWDGTDWRYFTNDAVLGATVNPPANV